MCGGGGWGLGGERIGCVQPSGAPVAHNTVCVHGCVSESKFLFFVCFYDFTSLEAREDLRLG